MFLMVLNDGETFTDLRSSMILEVPDDFDGADLRELVDGSSRVVYLFDERPPAVLCE